jgi:hypothetical protein
MPQKRAHTGYLALTQAEHRPKGCSSGGGAGLAQPQHGCSCSFVESESAETACTGPVAAGARAGAELEEAIYSYSRVCTRVWVSVASHEGPSTQQATASIFLPAVVERYGACCEDLTDL